ncbi:MAG: hypothetical protein KGJ51_06855 [Acidobacteriota bacterium]|nr:hypothetical protein [Acidobacteriota bacterium]
MNDERELKSSLRPIPNGSGAAAVLSAGIGVCAVAGFALAADKMPAMQRLMIFYRPTGPLSGVTTSAVVVWLLAWGALEVRWRRREVNLPSVGAAAIVLLILSLLLTFPPLADLL